jgi:hypothetical protein
VHHEVHVRPKLAQTQNSNLQVRMQTMGLCLDRYLPFLKTPFSKCRVTLASCCFSYRFVWWPAATKSVLILEINFKLELKLLSLLKLLTPVAFENMYYEWWNLSPTLYRRTSKNSALSLKINSAAILKHTNVHTYKKKYFVPIRFTKEITLNLDFMYFLHIKINFKNIN